MNHICLYSPATEHHCTLADTHFSSHVRSENELAWVALYTPRWFACPRPLDISYTGLEADVTILADGKQTSDL